MGAAELADLGLQHVVVEAGEAVQPLEAACGVVVAGFTAAEEEEVPRNAAEWKDAWHVDCLGSQLDQSLTLTWKLMLI